MAPSALPLQANRSWIVKMSEWALEPLSGNVRGLRQSGYGAGLNTRRNAAHIVVYHRYKQVLEEELISPVVILAMRNMYQTTFGFLMKNAGMYKYLQVPQHDDSTIETTAVKYLPKVAYCLENVMCEMVCANGMCMLVHACVDTRADAAARV